MRHTGSSSSVGSYTPVTTTFSCRCFSSQNGRAITTEPTSRLNIPAVSTGMIASIVRTSSEAGRSVTGSGVRPRTMVRRSSCLGTDVNDIRRQSHSIIGIEPSSPCVSRGLWTQGHISAGSIAGGSSKKNVQVLTARSLLFRCRARGTTTRLSITEVIDSCEPSSTGLTEASTRTSSCVSS